MCGGPVVGSAILRGKRNYRCLNARATESMQASCKASYIRADDLEQVVWDLVTEAITNPEVLANEVRRHVETGTGNLEKERAKLQREI